MSQNLPAVPSQHPTPSRTLAPVPALANTTTAMPDPAHTQPDLTAVAAPRLRAANPHPTHHTIPATVRHAGTMPTAALALRHQALPHLGIIPSPPEPSTTPAVAPSEPSATLAAVPTASLAAPTPMPSERPAAPAPTERSVAPGSAPAASPGAPAAAPGLGSDQSAAPERTAASRRALAVVPGPADGVATESTDAPKRVTAAGPGLPDARAWGGRLAQAVSEVLAGDRPISQLVRFTDEAVFADLNRRVRLLGLTTTATARGAKERSSVCSVRICTPAEEIAEIAAHVRHGDRSRAIALRLEIRRNRWICTALELG